MVITSSPAATGTKGSMFTYQITASSTPTNYNATGLPSWLGINTATGIISGTPAASGISTYSSRLPTPRGLAPGS